MLKYILITCTPYITEYGSRGFRLENGGAALGRIRWVAIILRFIALFWPKTFLCITITRKVRGMARMMMISAKIKVLYDDKHSKRLDGSSVILFSGENGSHQQTICWLYRLGRYSASMKVHFSHALVKYRCCGMKSDRSATLGESKSIQYLKSWPIYLGDSNGEITIFFN